MAHGNEHHVSGSSSKRWRRIENVLRDVIAFWAGRPAESVLAHSSSNGTEAYASNLTLVGVILTAGMIQYRFR